ncbi:hypothetical protein Y1Q_0011255 [Alligator mississippiensis]|uniref:MULE transposase domain-containing protein n=1 Tax=Alligator mississippiensis TaxID=8496 RepID=A0A151N840_ALLMI|nr:hypothetical protein Y1Q_0011255 [Alligator mississippiensis]
MTLLLLPPEGGQHAPPASGGVHRSWYESFFIVADEATDPQDNYILLILFVLGEWTDWDLSVFQTELVHLTPVNFYTMSQSTEKVTVSYGLEYNKISAFLSDSAMYTCKAFSDVLQRMLPNAVHVACKTHILSLVSDIWHMQFSDVDSLVPSFKKAFEHCPSCVWYMESIISQSGESHATVVLPPEPVLTRWYS